VDTKAIQSSEEQIAELQLSITRSEAQIQILVDGLVNLAAPAVPNRDFTDQTMPSPLCPKPKTWRPVPGCVKRSAARWPGSTFGFISTGKLRVW
jgi:hypothetical protein